MALDLLYSASGDLIYEGAELRLGETDDPCCCSPEVANCAAFNAYFNARTAYLTLDVGNGTCPDCAPLSGTYVLPPGGNTGSPACGTLRHQFIGGQGMVLCFGNTFLDTIGLAVGCDSRGFRLSAALRVSTGFGTQCFDVGSSGIIPFPWTPAPIPLSQNPGSFLAPGSSCHGTATIVLA